VITISAGPQLERSTASPGKCEATNFNDFDDVPALLLANSAPSPPETTAGAPPQADRQVLRPAATAIASPAELPPECGGRETGPKQRIIAAESSPGPLTTEVTVTAISAGQQLECTTASPSRSEVILESIQEAGAVAADRDNAPAPP
jgi:hypothetical protein